MHVFLVLVVVPVSSSAKYAVQKPRVLCCMTSFDPRGRHHGSEDSLQVRIWQLCYNPNTVVITVGWATEVGAAIDPLSHG